MTHAAQHPLPARWRAVSSLEELTQSAAQIVQHSDGPARHNKPSNLLGADSDVQAARSFLAEYEATPATQRAYTKEVERLLLWLVLSKKMALRDMTRADFADFSAFLADPQPRAAWCGPKRGRNCPRYSEHWRPFVGPLTPDAQHRALIVVNVFLQYLVAAHYLPANPLALMRRQALKQEASLVPSAHIAERVLSDRQWRAVREALAPPSLPPAHFDRHDPQGAPAFRAARERFIVALSYFLALRIGELTSHRMGHFRCVRGLWQFYVVGKGKKAAVIPVNDALLEELTCFRAWLALPPTPAPDEQGALVPRWEQGTDNLGTRRVHQILQLLFARAADSLALTAPSEAEHLRRASPHWLRHTSVTRQVEAGLSLAEVKANARHSKVETTMLYVHTEHDARHRTMQRHGWEQREQREDS